MHEDGHIIGWGYNGYGQTSVPSGNDFVYVAAAGDGSTGYGLAIKQDGSLKGWGYNGHGEINVPAGNDYVDVSGGNYHSVALRSDGSLITWGYNGHNQVSHTPSTGTYLQVSAHDYHSLALQARQEFVDLIIEDIDPETPLDTLLGQNTTVTGDVHMATNMSVTRNPIMTVAGTTSVASGVSLSLDADWTLDTAGLSLESGSSMNCTVGYDLTAGKSLTTEGADVTIDALTLNGGQFTHNGGTHAIPSVTINSGVFAAPSAYTVQDGESVSLAGGTITGTLVVAPTALFTFAEGAVDVDQMTVHQRAADELFSAAEAGKTKTVAGTIVAEQDVIMNLAADYTLPAGAEVVNRGTVRLSGSVLDRYSYADLVNEGTVEATGRIDGDFQNASSGRVRVLTDERIVLAGAANVNAGMIQAIEGVLDVLNGLENQAGGRVSLRDSVVDFGTGLNNLGRLEISYGTSDITGPIANTSGGAIICSGESYSTFYHDLHNEGEVRVSDTSSAVFFGPVHGNGHFTGEGLKYFEGLLAPGNSTGVINMEGQVAISNAGELEMELGGLGAGESDRIVIDGDLTLYGGDLIVSLYNGFVPEMGMTFDLLDWTTQTGTFDNVYLPELEDGLMWNSYSLYEDGTISVVPEPATMAVLCLGAIALPFRRNRR